MALKNKQIESLVDEFKKRYGEYAVVTRYKNEVGKKIIEFKYEKIPSDRRHPIRSALTFNEKTIPDNAGEMIYRQIKQITGA